MRIRNVAIVALIALLLGGCSGGALSTTPVAAPIAANTGPIVAPVATPSAAASSTVIQTALPAPGNGQPYDFAALAQFLVAAQPVAVSAAGTFGTITSISGNTITLSQSSMMSTADATGKTPDFVQNYASVGTPGGTITIAVTPAATIATPNGLADLRAGQTILAGGTANGAQLTAQFIEVLASPSVSTSALLGARRSTAAYTAPTSPPQTPATWTSATGTFTGSNGVPGGVHLQGESPTFVTAPYNCSIPQVAQTKTTGTASISVMADLALSLPQAVANFPYRVDYNPYPPSYVSNGGGFASPGAMSSWLNFLTLPIDQSGFQASPTYDVQFRFDASVALVVKDSCTGGSFTIAGGTVGYGYEVASYYGLPGNGQTIPTKPVKCIDINYPLHFSFPLNGTGGVNPIGNSQAGLSVCAVPTIKGEQNVFASLTNLAQLSSSGGQAIFDPSAAGAASVVSAPLLNPTGPSASFTFSGMQDLVFYQDAQTLEYSLFGICVAGLPSCSSGSNSAGVAIIPGFTTSLTATNANVQLNATTGAGCVGSDSRSSINSTNCEVSLRINTASNCISLNPNVPDCQTAIFTLNGLPPGTSATWSPADTGGTSSAPCSGPNFAPYYTVTPAGSNSGPVATFTFKRNGNTQPVQSTCRGTFLDQHGNPIKAMDGTVVEPGLLVNAYASS